MISGTWNLLHIAVYSDHQLVVVNGSASLLRLVFHETAWP